MLLEQKVVLVTGSTTGIGEAIARRAVAEGAQVMLHGLEEEWARQLCGDLGQDLTDYVVADLSIPAACERIVEQTVSRFGRIDGLVNNAAANTRSAAASAGCPSWVLCIEATTATGTGPGPKRAVAAAPGDSLMGRYRFTTPCARRPSCGAHRGVPRGWLMSRPPWAEAPLYAPSQQSSPR